MGRLFQKIAAENGTRSARSRAPGNATSSQSTRNDSCILGWVHAVVGNPMAAQNCICVSSDWIDAETIA